MSEPPEVVQDEDVARVHDLIRAKERSAVMASPGPTQEKARQRYQREADSLTHVLDRLRRAEVRVIETWERLTEAEFQLEVAKQQLALADEMAESLEQELDAAYASDDDELALRLSRYRTEREKQ